MKQRGINGHELPPELQYSGRLDAALSHGRMMKIAGAPEKAIAGAIVRHLIKSKPAV